MTPRKNVVPMRTKRTAGKSGEDWYKNQLHLKTIEALIKQHEAFALQNAIASDAEILEYVHACSEALGKTPNANEVIGGTYIEKRFGGWDTVVSAAKLPEPERALAVEKTQIYKKEYKRQEKLFRKNKQQEKIDAKALRRKKDDEGRQADLTRVENDMAWGRLHEHDSDEQLLCYVKTMVEELGHTPVAQEVPGAAYISQRFGSWAVVLTVAGLPLPVGVKPANPKTLKLYLERQKKTAAE